jgi:Mg2+ and Co2+ transporter CorA
MNFKAIPGLDSPEAFHLSLGAMAMAVLAMLACFRLRRWL